MPPTIGSFEQGEKVDGETRVRRGFRTPAILVSTPAPGVNTAHDVLLFAAKRHANKQAVGWRDIVTTIDEEKDVKKNIGGKDTVEKKKWTYFQLSDYKYWTFAEFKDKVQKVASGLRELGIEPGNVFNVYAATSANWQLASHACASMSITVATAYDTLGESGLQHSLAEPEVRGVFTNADLLKTLLKVLANTPTVKLIVYDGKADEGILEKLRTLGNGDVKVLHIDEVEKLGAEKPHDTVPPKKEDVACIMYTSGTTGSPKGVVITHANLTATIGSVYTLVGHHLREGDSFLAYLPLAHIFEYVVELTFFFAGMTTGYGRVRTLTDASVRNCLGDLRAFCPTIMVGVPAVWETIRKGIMGKVNSGGAIKKGVFNAAVSLKKAMPMAAGALDTVVFNQVKSQTGGRLRLALNGGAPLALETQEFLTTALVTILSGYGLTETCAMCAILPPEFMQYGPVGVPVPSVEMKLVDMPEANYLATNDPPQGEVLVRGPSVCKGYFKRPDLDKEAFTEDGWLMTGDVGQWNKDGTLSIIDRKKNLVKLQGGEYIALERLESVYKSCQLVNNICVHASSEAKQPMAVIHPHEGNLRAYCASNNISSSTDPHELCADPKVRDAVLKECNAVAKKAGLKPMETLEAVVLTPDEWTPESGLVTAAQKIQRKKIAERYGDDIKKVYNLNKD